MQFYIADIASFKNILNEMYAKDISKKIKSAYKVRIARGEYHGAFALFGYAKGPNKKQVYYWEDFRIMNYGKFYDI